MATKRSTVRDERVSGSWQSGRWAALLIALLVVGCTGERAPAPVSSTKDAGPPAAGSTTNPGHLSVEQARALLAQHSDALLLDVREPDEWSGELGHIEGARLLPLGQLGGRLAEIEEWKERPVVAVCRSGNRSGQAARMLAEAGFREVYNLEGGMIAWRRAGH
jgi:rhodanese-related sulfurtransferase